MSGGIHIRVKLGVWGRDDWRCQYCGVEVVRTGAEQPEDADDTATVDHVIPKAAGGSNRVGNLLTACFRCNQDKGCGGPLSPWQPPTLGQVWPDLSPGERALFAPQSSDRTGQLNESKERPSPFPTPGAQR